MDKGVYILILRLASDRWMTVGRLGRRKFFKGFYVYVGSAFGPGGLSARLRHHLKVKEKCHWHIDTFAQHADIAEIWYAEQDRHEHLWARAATGLAPVSTPILGFGCSDCSCGSHLIYFPQRPRFRQFERCLKHHTGGSHGLKKLNLGKLRRIEKPGGKCKLVERG